MHEKKIEPAKQEGFLGEDEKNMGVNLVLFLDDLTSQNNDLMGNMEFQLNVLLPRCCRRRLFTAPRACRTRSHANLRCVRCSQTRVRCDTRLPDRPAGEAPQRHGRYWERMHVTLCAAAGGKNKINGDLNFSFRMI